MDSEELRVQQVSDTHDCDDSTYWSPSRTCKVCGEPSTGESTAYLCARVQEGPREGHDVRTEGRSLPTHVRTMEAVRLVRCYYTGVKLELEDRTDVRYRE
jgi:hypothetical protein